MARINGMAQPNGHEPPPSSMLATHFKPGRDLPHLNDKIFTQLLQEVLKASLGQNESGLPNVGDDPASNWKLVVVVVQMGIDPLLNSEKDNPFRPSHGLGKDLSQLQQCLTVLHLAISRTRSLLYQPLTPDESNVLPTILYSYLLPKVLSIIARGQDPEITKTVFSIIFAGLNDEKGSGIGTSSPLKDFLSLCFTGLLNIANKDHYRSFDDEITFVDSDFLLQPSPRTSRHTGISNVFGITSIGQLLYLACQLATFLSQHQTSNIGITRLKKQTTQLQNILDDLYDRSGNAAQVEALSAQLNGFSLASMTEAGSFTTVGETSEWSENDRARKRPRLSTDHNTEALVRTPVETIVSNLTFAFTKSRNLDLAGLSLIAPEKFRALSEDDRSTCLTLLGETACRLHELDTALKFSCSICDDQGIHVGSSEAHQNRTNELLQTLLVLKPLVQKHSKQRLLALQALRRVLSHVHSFELLRLKGSSAGEWCLQAMRSSSRELKICAARTLQAFVHGYDGRDSSMLHENRVVALEYLQALWNDGSALNQEAVVLALFHIVRVVGEEDTNIILARLVDYLGHQNSYIAALVFSEFQQLGQMAMGQLFRPYWRTLSMVVVRNFVKKPAIAQQLSELVGTQVDGLLQIMEEHALPYLVLSRDINTINRMCALSSSAMTSLDLCTKPNNLPKILAFLLMQNFQDPEHSIMALLANVSDEFREQDLTDWTNLYYVDIACELLKLIADSGRGKASKAYQGLQLLAQMQWRRSASSSSASSRRVDVMGIFLENNCLPLVNLFSNKMNFISLFEPNLEKRRYLLALGEIAKLGKGHVNVALPHICACLRSAVDEDALCNTAFGSWCMMLTNIDEDELRELINQTFVLIIRCWHRLDSNMQEQAYNLVAGIFKDHEAVIRDSSSTLPSIASIPIMLKFDSDIVRLKKQKDERNQLASFVQRLEDENLIVVEQALRELLVFLRQKSEFVQKSILREQPDTLIADLTRVILDVCVKFSSSTNLLLYGGQCLGVIGCLDPSKLDSKREKKRFVVLSNFAEADETTGFLMFFLEQVLVKEYVSSSNLREKGFLAWSLQRLLQICDLPEDITSRARVGGLSGKDRQWFGLSDITRLVLTPFLTSKFQSVRRPQKANIEYPFFKPNMTYKTWLTEITLDCLNRGLGDNVDMIFDVCARLVVHGQGTSIASFLLPFAALNVLLTGNDSDKRDLLNEMTCVLQQTLTGADNEMQDHIRQCSQSVFDILDYLSQWLQDNRKQAASAKARIERGIRDPALERILERTEIIESVVDKIPSQIITQKAVECRSYARALYHQEQYVMSQSAACDADFRRLQDIYAQIDEPDGIEGYSAQMKFVDVESEIMEHKKSGRWNAAQSWYEMRLTESPDNVDLQSNLLRCLKESGQHDVLIHHFDGIVRSSESSNSILFPYAIEAAWVGHRWDKLVTYLDNAPRGDFAVGLGSVMLALKQSDLDTVHAILEQMYQSCATELTPSSTVSFEAGHDSLLKMHILDDVRMMIESTGNVKQEALPALKRRLDILGSNVADKQYVLGIHRAIMHLRSSNYDNEDIASSWMASARLARKATATQQAFNAVLRASVLGAKSAAIEQAKIMWQEGDHRKAIQTLQSAIDSGVIGSQNPLQDVDPMTTMTMENAAYDERNDVSAKAFVLLGKWLDQAGQTQSDVIIKTFRKSTQQNRRCESGWYSLGRHYNKILESEKLKPPGKENQPFLTGETTKLVIDNFLRALVSGNKYMFQTLPKVLTLWLELVGSEIEHDSRRGNSQFHQHNKTQRKKIIEETNANVKKYVDRLQAYALYTILPQLVARICHPDPTVNGLLQALIVKVVKAYPQQALWTVLATVKSASKDRATRGLSLLKKTSETAKKDSKVFSASEMREFINASQKLSDELLRVADFTFEGRIFRVSLSREFGFNHKIAPSKLVVPSEACLIPSIPSGNDIQTSKSHRAFAKDPITISAFMDDARVLPSLQKPRKLSLRGSDGQIYNVLAKPHDDLRKDQRLMEFNTMINRFLKHDIEAAKRRLYIRTYAVIPLNEQCGLIEWVGGLMTMRDILLKLYEQRGIRPDYAATRDQLDKLCARSEDLAKDFVEQVQSRFPPVLRQWFVENFPDPTAWFNARLRYTRTSAVMSMVGHSLGLGDRHGENILFEEETGGVLHVDFNCLFDKGLTFEKPERVPFRLTHNMRNAMGSYHYDGPFRRCCELTTTLLRSNEDALMTILETFLHDPTTDFQTSGKKKRPGGHADSVPVTAEQMLEGVKGKVRGMLPGESVPLSVGGYVDYMIKQAKDEANLARMYIGWCAFL